MSRRAFPLGRLREHDPRSRAFAFSPATLTLPAYSVTHTRRVPIFDQGSLGSCTGNAAAGWLGSDPHGTAKADEALAVSLYSEATRLDGFDGEYPPDDSGSSGNAVAKALKRRGLITRYEHAFSFRAALAAIVVAPVIVGVPWYENMFEPLDSGYVEIGGDVVGGHEFLIRGIDPRRQHVLCDNSWSTAWGRRGRFWLRFATLERLLAEQGDCTILHR